MKKHEWLLCPACGNKTRIKLREDTELKNFPLFCPKCKQETLINVIINNKFVIEKFDEHPSWVNENVPGEFTVIAKKCK